MFKKSLKNLLALTALILCIIVIQSNLLTAQVRPISRTDSATGAYMGNWFYPSEYQFETNFPLLNTIPPITTGMPYEIMLSYIFLDSLIRNYPPALDTTIVKRWFDEKSKNDTVKAVLKYLYKLQDYDPVRFILYAYSTGHAFIPYNTTLYAIKGKINRLLEAVQTLFDPSITALMDLLQADYVLKVHVNSINSLPWFAHPDQFAFGVNATVLDTLKGRVYKNQCPVIPDDAKN